LEKNPSPDEVLQYLLPPRFYEYEGKYYMQRVSNEEASREDVANL